LADVAAGPGGTLWAVGNSSSAGAGSVIEEMTAGSWVNATPSLPATALLDAVSAASSNDVWAVGNYIASDTTTPFIEHWDGTSWTQVASPAVRGELQGVLALSASDAWAVGLTSTANKVMTLIEHWDGQSWSVVPSPSPGTEDELYAIAGNSDSSLWAVGSQGSLANSTSRPLTEYWDGVDWRSVKAPARGYSILRSVTDISPSDAWSVGYSSRSGRNHLLAEHWNGSAWRTVSLPRPASASTVLLGVAAVGPNDVWVAGISSPGHDEGFAENWNGKSWTVSVMPNPQAENEIGAVTVLPDGSAWSVGSAGSLGEPYQAVAEQICPAGITDSGFLPATVTDEGWRTVAWMTQPSDGSSHTVSDGTGMGLFNSGPLRSGTPFSFTFFASGSYPVTAAPAPSGELVDVPMSAQPASGSPSTTFTVKWASGAAPFGYVYDVMIKAPNATGFSPFVTGVSGDTGTFTPSDGPGTYQFEARLRKADNDVHSAWSPPLSIPVA
jgi:plastocyanin